MILRRSVWIPSTCDNDRMVKGGDLNRRIWLLLAVLVVLATLVVFFWRRGQKESPRWAAMKPVEQLQQALIGTDDRELLDTLVMPPGLAGRTEMELAQFVRKALRDEVSPEGIAVLRKNGQFGPLKEVFPKEAGRWAGLFGVKPEECVAFRAENHGIRAEVVIFTNAPQPRILRINNVKQLTDPRPKGVERNGG